MAMNKAYLLIGGNMGNRTGFLQAARVAIGEQCGWLAGVSSLYQTAAWGLKEQAPFLNQAIDLQTALTPTELLQQILAIETELGRQREQTYGPRTIDIDILLFGSQVVRQPNLVIPHPRLQHRRFALTPLAELAPGLVHPVLQKTIAQLLLDCADPLGVQKISAADG